MLCLQCQRCQPRITPARILCLAYAKLFLLLLLLLFLPLFLSLFLFLLRPLWLLQN